LRRLNWPAARSTSANEQAGAQQGQSKGARGPNRQCGVSAAMRGGCPPAGQGGQSGEPKEEHEDGHPRRSAASWSRLPQLPHADPFQLRGATPRFSPADGEFSADRLPESYWDRRVEIFDHAGGFRQRSASSLNDSCGLPSSMSAPE
jgi:hypothetical protein